MSFDSKNFPRDDPERERLHRVECALMSFEQWSKHGEDDDDCRALFHCLRASGLTVELIEHDGARTQSTRQLVLACKEAEAWIGGVTAGSVCEGAQPGDETSCECWHCEGSRIGLEISVAVLTETNRHGAEPVEPNKQSRVPKRGPILPDDPKNDGLPDDWYQSNDKGLGIVSRGCIDYLQYRLRYGPIGNKLTHNEELVAATALSAFFDILEFLSGGQQGVKRAQVLAKLACQSEPEGG